VDGVLFLRTLAAWADDREAPGGCVMPTVGTGKKKKQFPYTPAGEAAAAQTAKRTGQPLTVDPKKKKKPFPFGMGSDKKRK
jgi:hypothetical protein